MSVILSAEMAILVNDVLEKEFGIPKKSLFNPSYHEFSKIDLARITSLNIVNFDITRQKA